MFQPIRHRNGTISCKSKATQGRRLIAALWYKPHTYLEMHMLGISTCPEKRITESLRDTERLVKGEKRGLVTWQVKRAAP